MADEPQPSTSISVLQVEVNPDFNRNHKGKETMRIIAHVIRECEDEAKDPRITEKLDVTDHWQRAAKLTGFDCTEHLKKFMNLPNVPVVTELYTADRSVIHDGLLEFYLKKKCMPTTKQLFTSLRDKLPPHVDIRDFRNLLKKMGYIWKNIKNYGLVVIEKPAVTYERYHYLKRIMEYRKENRPIFYVDRAKTVPLYYAVSKHGIEVESINPPDFDTWLEACLIPSIPPNSVIVMNYRDYNSAEIRKLPTFDSLKQDMIDWLEFHDVPCSRNLSKTELINLVEKYTNIHEKLYKSDVIIKNYGHDVLRVPKCIDKVALTRLVAEFVKKNMVVQKIPENETRAIILFLKTMDSDTLTEYDEFIAQEEKTIFENDMLVDKYIDELHVSSVKTDKDSDVASCSDSE